jgi:hypothetical protein
MRPANQLPTLRGDRIVDTKTDGHGAPKSADEAIESGLRSIDAIADLTRQNMEAMLSIASVANQSLQELVGDVAAFSRKNVERTAAAAQAMTTVTSPADLAQLQADFARTQFEAAIAEMAKFSETMFRTAREQIAAQQTPVTTKAK